MSEPITPSVPATQVQHPWRSTVRTIFVVLVALLTLIPVIVATAGIPVVGVVAQILAVAAAVQRVLALPQVEEFLESNVPWLAAKPAVVEMPAGAHQIGE